MRDFFSKFCPCRLNPSPIYGSKEKLILGGEEESLEQSKQARKTLLSDYSEINPTFFSTHIWQSRRRQDASGLLGDGRGPVGEGHREGPRAVGGVGVAGDGRGGEPLNVTDGH